MIEPSQEEVIRVCYVDDSATDLEFMERLINGNVFFQTSDSFENITPEQYDVVLLDLGLEHTSGLDTLHAYMDQFGDTVPVIVFSGADDEMVRRQALHLGAADYIKKGTITDAEPLMRILERVVLQNGKRRSVFDKYLLDRLTCLNASVKEHFG